MMLPAAFSPAAFGITPQKITLRGYSEDRFPRARPGLFRSGHPLCAHARRACPDAQNRFDRQITELEDLARRELNLFEENERLERLEGDELQNEENRERLETQEQEEAETQRRMEELTEKMEQLMKDAARNGDIDKKTLQKMAESLKSMQELSQEDIPKVRKNSATPRSNPTPRKSPRRTWIRRSRSRRRPSRKCRRPIEKANDANRRFEAGTFVNRLKKAAGEENGIVGSLKEGFERMLGLNSAAWIPPTSAA
jgi:hypothetical protein